MDIFYIRRLQTERIKGIYQCHAKNIVRKLSKNTIMYITQP